MSSSFGGALATPQIVARRAFALTDCLFSALSGALRSGSCVAPTSSVVATATAVRARHGTLPNPSHWRRRRAAGDSTRPQLRAPRLAALVQRSQCGLPHTPQGPLPVRSGSRRRCRCCRRRRHPCPLPARRCGRHPRRQRPRCRPSWPLQREVSDACEKARAPKRATRAPKRARASHATAAACCRPAVPACLPCHPRFVPRCLPLGAGFSLVAGRSAAEARRTAASAVAGAARAPSLARAPAAGDSRAACGSVGCLSSLLLPSLSPPSPPPLLFAPAAPRCCRVCYHRVRCSVCTCMSVSRHVCGHVCVRHAALNAAYEPE